MREYVFSVLCAAIASGVLCVVAPEKSSLSKYISFACGLAVALVILSPLAGGVLDLSPDAIFGTSDGATVPQNGTDTESGESGESGVSGESRADSEKSDSATAKRAKQAAKQTAEQTSMQTARYTAQSAVRVLSCAVGVKETDFSAEADVADDGSITEIRIYADDAIIIQKSEMSEKLSEIFGVKITVFDKDGS